MQKPAPYTPIAAPRPAAPPVYRPQAAVSQGKLTAAGAATRLAPGPTIAPAPPVYRPAPTAVELQPRLAPPAVAVLQLKVNKCLVCNHRHGSSTCATMVGGKPCGCKSHSGHWKKGSKVNPGSGKHGRKRAAAQAGKG
jgi:hypothetical protein